MGKQSEARLQQEIIMWWHNTYPQYRGLLCYNLNNSVGGKRGNDNKFLGLVAGRSDLVLYFNKKAYMIELKNEIGRQKPAQLKWQTLIESQGFEYVIIRTLEDFKKYIEKL